MRSPRLRQLVGIMIVALWAGCSPVSTTGPEDADSSNSDTNRADTAEPSDTGADAEDAAPRDTHEDDPDAATVDCAEAATEPVANASFDLPSDPVAGRSLSLSVAADQAFTNIHLMARHADGTEEASFVSATDVGDGFQWTFSLANARAGTYCLLFTSDDATPSLIAATTMTVREGEQTGEGGSAYKLVEHHQDTCEENGFGIGVRARVLDAQGNPMSGVPLEISWDSTPVMNVDRWWTDGNTPPREMVTGDDGWASFQNGWPIWTDQDGETHFQIFEVSVKGLPSDTATEITTGYWEEVERAGGGTCRWCPSGTSNNVWGHWSYRMVFQLTEDASEICTVNHDHAGQAACSPDEVYLEPETPQCTAL